MAADWYCEIEGEQYGPITAGQLKQLATDGKLQPAHSVWKEGMNVSVQARTVKGLFESAPAAAPAAAPSPASTPPPTKKPAATPAAPTPAAPAPAAKSSAATTAKQLAALGEPDKAEEGLVEFETIEEEPANGELIEFEMVSEEIVEEFEVVEEEEEPKAKKKSSEDKGEKEKKKKEPEAEVLAEVAVIYREGYPDLDGPIEGQLTVESTGLRFQFEDDDEFRLSFEKVEDMLEPAKGDFSPSMKKKALAKNLGGKAGKLAAGLLGKWMGGDAGKVVGKVGGAAGDMAASGSDLGKPPRNRIAVYARIKKARCKILFDANGADGDDMTQEAKALFKVIQKAKNKAESAAVASGGDATINIVVNEAPGGEKGSKGGSGAARAAAGGGGVPGPIAPVTGKPFRVMNGGSVSGPFSLDELRGQVNSGKLGGDALIGVETWMPLSTIGNMIGSAPSTNGAAPGAPAKPGAAAKTKEDVKEEESDDLDEVEDQEEEVDEQEEMEDVEEEDSPSEEEGDSLPVDEEFKL